VVRKSEIEHDMLFTHAVVLVISRQLKLGIAPSLSIAAVLKKSPQQVIAAG
jgi:hypothetical protein